VVRQRGDPWVSAEHAGYLADHIPGAAYVELEGDEHLPTAPFVPRLLDLLVPFLQEAASAAVHEPDKVLATVLFSDIVSSTEQSAVLGDAGWRDTLGEHHARIRRQLARFRGVELDTSGDGFFARFDGPARAIRCALAIHETVQDMGLQLRIGIHTGECEVLDGKVTGIAVAIGARVAGKAAGGEVLVSQTVKDLVAGSDITFEDHGLTQLKGVPGQWQLFAVTHASAAGRSRRSPPLIGSSSPNASNRETSSPRPPRE
jgi:class 3 adenylate cyclase